MLFWQPRECAWVVRRSFEPFFFYFSIHLESIDFFFVCVCWESLWHSVNTSEVQLGGGVTKCEYKNISSEWRGCITPCTAYAKSVNQWWEMGNTCALCVLHFSMLTKCNVIAWRMGNWLAGGIMLHCLMCRLHRKILIQSKNGMCMKWIIHYTISQTTNFYAPQIRVCYRTELLIHHSTFFAVTWINIILFEKRHISDKTLKIFHWMGRQVFLLSSFFFLSMLSINLDAIQRFSHIAVPPYIIRAKLTFIVTRSPTARRMRNRTGESDMLSYVPVQ